MPEPTPQPGDSTPWGAALSGQPLAKGIWFVSTASHGGLWLSDERMAQLPEAYEPFTGSRRWAEEDVDAGMLACFFDLPNASPTACDRAAFVLGGRAERNWNLINKAAGKAAA